MWKLKFDRFGHAKGTVVYALAGSDYGCASTDSKFTQIPHVSVTLDPEGGVPFFTVPTNYLEEIPANDA